MPDPRATTGADTPPGVRATTRASPTGGSSHNAVSSSSLPGSGRPDTNSSDPSGRNAGWLSPFSDQVSRTGPRSPRGSISHSAET
ncbi:MAG: hypothetical protein FWJ93_09345 [Micromonosporaceae bacterium]